MSVAFVQILCAAAGAAVLVLLCVLYRRLIADHKRLERQASLLSEQAQLLDLANDAILVWELSSGEIRFWNRGAELLYGWSKGEALGRTPQAILDTQFPVPLSEINRQLVQDGHWEGELDHTCRDGHVVTVSSRWALQLDQQGRPTAVLGINTDMTARIEFERELQYQALHDSLTGLPNRTLFNDRLEHALANASRHNTQVAVLFLDLNNFKEINDTFGHEAGDALLIEVAQRLRMCLRASDTVARIGGDEFTCLLSDLAHRSEAGIVAQRIEAALAAPVYIAEQQVRVTASIGVAFSASQSTPETLMRAADRSMYERKQRAAVSDVAAGSTLPGRRVPSRTNLALPVD